MNPNATNQTISWFRKYHNDEELDLTPAFQRKPVWNDEQASYLIDSILNDLPVPELFVRTVTDGKGETKLEVVDGQQRLRSIIRFYSKDLTLIGKDVTAEWIEKSWDSIGEKAQAKFWKFKLIVRELENATDAEVRDMFRRLNANQSNLNAQELRHSQYSGQFISFVEDLADDEWWLDRKVATPAQIRRMLDVEYVSELLVGLMAGPLNKKIGLDEYFSDYDSEFPDQRYWKKVINNIRELIDLHVGDNLRTWKSKTEFYTLFLTIGLYVREANALPENASESLLAFRNVIDRAKKKDTKEKFPDWVTDYKEAVTRAATDLSRRISRIQILAGVLEGEHDSNI